jgi:hypothetical protein
MVPNDIIKSGAEFVITKHGRLKMIQEFDVGDIAKISLGLD